MFNDMRGTIEQQKPVVNTLEMKKKITRGSLMWYLYNRGAKLINDGGDPILPPVVDIPILQPETGKVVRWVKGPIVVVDLGQGFGKPCTQSLEHELIAETIYSVLQNSEKSQFGEEEGITWEVVRTGRIGKGFKTGKQAFRPGTSNNMVELTRGETAARLADPRYVDYILANIVQMLMQAGFKEGNHTICLGLGVRAEDVKVIGGKQVLTTEVQNAISVLKGTHTIVAESPTGERSTWTITVGPIFSNVQTIGIFFTYFYSPDFKVIQREYYNFGHLDIGTYDMTFAEVVYTPGKPVSVLAKSLGRGAVEIAEALRGTIKEHYGLELTVLEVIKALVDGFFYYGGKRIYLNNLKTEDERLALIKASREDGLVSEEDKEEAKREGALKRTYDDQVQNLVGRATPAITRQDLFLTCSGGGVLLPTLSDQLYRSMLLHKRRNSNTLIVPPDRTIPGKLNSFGLYAYTYSQLALYVKQLRIQEQTIPFLPR